MPLYRVMRLGNIRGNIRADRLRKQREPPNDRSPCFVLGRLNFYTKMQRIETDKANKKNRIYVYSKETQEFFGQIVIHVVTWHILRLVSDLRVRS